MSSPQPNSFVQYFRSKYIHFDSPRSVILVQCAEDLFYLGLFGLIVSSLREQQSVRVEQYVLRSLREGESRSLFALVASRCFINPLHNFKWVRLYKSYCDGVAYRNGSFHPITDAIDLYRAWVCWRKLADRKALIDLVIDNIAVGDLINDSFLRFKPACTVDLQDGYLLILLWQAHRDVRWASNYFAKIRPRLYLTSYSTYAQHGIPVRVALQHGARVFSFGNYQEFTKELTLEDLVHTRNPDSYADDFSKLSCQEEKLALADAALSARMAGTVDSATAYMKKSAYTESDEMVPNVSGAVVIFLHDFFDSPHVYRELVFPDFWEWACFTIDTLKAASVPIFVKPHPNQVSLSGNALSELKLRYPDMLMIPASVTNKQLAEAGMVCGVTVYGTVAHEMAYLGVPTIACAHHPHISFNFCRTARSRDEYAEYLRTYAKPCLDRLNMRRESLIFYYMHNLCMEEEERALRDAVVGFRLACRKTDGASPDLVGMVQHISQLPGYKARISSLATTID